MKLKQVLLRLRPVNYFFLNSDKTKAINILSKYDLLKNETFHDNKWYFNKIYIVLVLSFTWMAFDIFLNSFLFVFSAQTTYNCLDNISFWEVNNVRLHWNSWGRKFFKLHMFFSGEYTAWELSRQVSDEGSDLRSCKKIF